MPGTTCCGEGSRATGAARQAAQMSRRRNPPRRVPCRPAPPAQTPRGGDRRSGLPTAVAAPRRDGLRRHVQRAAR
eukprot:296256-Chlamydomonas_euryale.AAC.4